jgi:hypothetical protein
MTGLTAIDLPCPQETAPGYYCIDVHFCDPNTRDDLGAPQTVGYLTVGDDDSGRIATDSIVRFGDAIEVTQAAATLDQPGETDAVLVDLTWQTDKAIDNDYTRFVHILDA